MDEPITAREVEVPSRPVVEELPLAIEGWSATEMFAPGDGVSGSGDGCTCSDGDGAECGCDIGHDEKGCGNLCSCEGGGGASTESSPFTRMLVGTRQRVAFDRASVFGAALSTGQRALATPSLPTVFLGWQPTGHQAEANKIKENDPASTPSSSGQNDPGYQGPTPIFDPTVYIYNITEHAPTVGAGGPDGPEKPTGVGTPGSGTGDGPGVPDGSVSGPERGGGGGGGSGGGTTGKTGSGKTGKGTGTAGGSGPVQRPIWPGGPAIKMFNPGTGGFGGGRAGSKRPQGAVVQVDPQPAPAPPPPAKRPCDTVCMAIVALDYFHDNLDPGMIFDKNKCGINYATRTSQIDIDRANCKASGGSDCDWKWFNETNRLKDEIYDCFVGYLDGGGSWNAIRADLGASFGTPSIPGPCAGSPSLLACFKTSFRDAYSDQLPKCADFCARRGGR